MVAWITEGIDGFRINLCLLIESQKAINSILKNTEQINAFSWSKLDIISERHWSTIAESCATLRRYSGAYQTSRSSAPARHRRRNPSRLRRTARWCGGFGNDWSECRPRARSSIRASPRGAFGRWRRLRWKPESRSVGLLWCSCVSSPCRIAWWLSSRRCQELNWWKVRKYRWKTEMVIH